MKALRAVIAACLIFVSGCGYTTGSLLPSYLKTIYVDNFKNNIDISTEPEDQRGFKVYRPGIETDVTKAVIDKFIFDGHLPIVSKDRADLVLTGEIVDYYQQPLRYDNYDNVEEYRVIITVNMQLKDMVKDTVMWDEKGFIGYDTYRLTGESAKTEAEASRAAVDDLANRITEKVVEGW